MIKLLTKLLKMIFFLGFIALTILLLLYSLTVLNKLSLDFSFLTNLPYWDRVQFTIDNHRIGFSCLLFGITTFCAYISILLVFSKIPLAGKLLKIVFKILIGWLLVFASVVLITVGGVIVSGMIPGF